jgi:hypothetical protein
MSQKAGRQTRGFVFLITSLTFTFLIIALPASATIPSFAFRDLPASPITRDSIFQDTFQKIFGIPHLPHITPGTSDNAGTDVPWTSENEAIEIALANGVSEDPCCPGISATNSMIKVNGKWTSVWRVSGPCGKIVFIDRTTGEVVGTDLIACYCACVYKV